MWFEKWHKQGPICKIIDKEFIANAGMDLKAKVYDLIDDQGWGWPIDWDGMFDNVTNIPVLNLNVNKKDRAICVNKNGKEVEFSTKEVWKDIRDDSPKVI